MADHRAGLIAQHAVLALCLGDGLLDLNARVHDLIELSVQERPQIANGACREPDHLIPSVNEFAGRSS